MGKNRSRSRSRSRRKTGDKTKDVEKNGGEEPSEGFVIADEFKDKSVRKNFVAKVYAIVSAQLLFSGAAITGLMMDERMREYLYDYSWLGYAFLIVNVFIYLVLVCCESVRKCYPCNYFLLILMTVFVIAESAVWSARYEVKVVFLAMLGTGLITVVMSLTAKFAPFDVTGCGYFFFVAFIILAILSVGNFVLSFFLITNLLNLIIASVAVVILSLYIVFITQLILGGRRGSIPPDEPVLAAIVLYTTIMEIFLELLTIIEACFNYDDDDS